MKHKTQLFAAAALALATAACSSDDDPTQRLPVSLEDKVVGLRADLESQGLDVARGDFTLFTIEDCQYPIQTIGNCYGNNPTSPYVVPAVPQWADEFVDPTLTLAVKPLEPGTSATFRLGEREALIVLAQMPPEAAYFGLQTYVYSRQGALDPTDGVYGRVANVPDIQDLLFDTSPNPSRVMTFASIGNSINDVVIERASGAAFGEQRFFVITPDAALARDLTDALLRAGVPSRDHIFVEPVSPEVVRLGLGESADDLMTIVRYSLPTDETAGTRWRAQLPLAVLRVRDTSRTTALEPFARPAYEARTATPELHLAPHLLDLIAEVKQRWGQPDAATERFLNPFALVDLVGQHCLERPMNCLGDTQDTDTYRISRPITLDDGEVVAVVGTLATATGNATYVSLSVNWAEVLMSVANLNDRDLAGTASGYASTVDQTGSFYVTYLARDCQNLPNCLDIPESLVPRGETLKLIQRNYIHPGTARGANPLELLTPRTIVFDGASRPANP